MPIKASILSLAMVLTPSFYATAETTPTEKAQETVEDAAKHAHKAGRAASDKACPIVNGKVDCAMKKGKHKVQNLGDEMKDKADDVQKKAD